MSAAREAILARTRAALGRRRGSAADGDDDPAHLTVEARLSSPAPTLIPARGDLDPEARIDLFTKQAEGVQANVLRVKTKADLPGAIAAYLRGQNLPLSLVTAADPDLTEAPWEEGLWEIRQGRPRETDPIGLTKAVAGIAETGTLMLASDKDHPTTLAFLPETSIIALPSAEVHRAYEDAFRRLREQQALPRSVNLITGPSRSGDIEQTLQLGAHGPKRLLIILVDEMSGLDPQAKSSTAGGAPPDRRE
jgi:L-lactate dehydrogenase complex protein LldG